MKSTALKVKAVSDKILKTEKYPWKKLLAYQPPGLKKTRMKAKGGILAPIGQGVRNIANRFRIDPTRGGIF